MKLTIVRFINATALVLLVLSAKASAQEFRYEVKHDHAFGSCKGQLIIAAEGMKYETGQKEHARQWSYKEIKMIELASPREVRVLTYESRWLKLGRDETFKFTVLEGAVTKQASDFLLARVEKPLATSFLKSDETPAYQFAVRHRHSFGGEQGTLRIYRDALAYDSARVESSRYWRWTDIQGISRTGPFTFAVTTYEPEFGGPTKTYNFDLKERMSDEVFDLLWSEIYKVTLPAAAQGKQ